MTQQPYPAVRHFVESLSLLNKKEHMVFYQDSNVPSYLNFAWIPDHHGIYYDFVRAIQLHPTIMSTSTMFELSVG